MALVRRACNWKHADGHEATVCSLAEAMNPFATTLARAGTTLYSSIDMKQGVNMDLLIQHMPMLIALCRLDPRGGLIGQHDLATAAQREFDINKFEPIVPKYMRIWRWQAP